MRSRYRWIVVALVAVCAFAGTARADIIDCTVRDIQDTSSVLWDTLVTAGTTPDTLRTTGVVTGADTFPTGLGFYIEDFTLAAQFRGIDIFTGSHNSYADSGLVRGQKVRVTGRVTEFSGGTELVSMNGGAFGDSLRIEHNLGNPGIPGPLVLSTADISERSVLAEPYEGMFVKLNHTIRVTNTSSLPFGSWQGVDNTIVSCPAGICDTILVDQATLANPTVGLPAVGNLITFVQGIVDQRGIPSGTQNRGYRIQIRDGADVLLPTPPVLLNAYAISADSIRVVFDRSMDPSTAQTVAGHYSRATTKAIDSATLMPNPDTGVMQYVDLACISDPMTTSEPESLVATGVKSSLGVTMAGAQGSAFLAGLTPIADVQTSLSPYNGPGGSDTTQYLSKKLTVRGTVTAHLGTLVWLENSSGGLRDGVKLFSPTELMSQGDDVTIVGFPVEFFDETEFSGAIFERNNGPGVMPAPVDVAAASLEALNDTTAAGGTREDYEGVLVRIHDVAVSDSNVGFGEWIAKRGGPCFIDATCEDTVHVDDRGAGNYTYEVHTGNQLASVTGPVEIAFNVLKLEPRTDADFVAGPVTSVDGNLNRLALAASSGNPIAFTRGSMHFAITLPTRGAPTLSLYDLRGRLVTTLLSGQELSEGTHSIEWTGADRAGRQVASGIYFGQLRLGNGVALTKVVVAN